MYSGAFQCNLPHGYGIETWPDGTTYQGSYEMGKKNGVGKFSWNDTNEMYQGYFKDDQFHGQGRYEWADGRIYDGEWLSGKMNG